ncbi:unnamed protein product [Chrysoparadoxa australica]
MAKELSWERLHSGPSWSAVEDCDRQSYGLAGCLSALCLVAAGKVPAEVLKELDLVALMGEAQLQGIANACIACLETHCPPHLLQPPRQEGTSKKPVKQRRLGEPETGAASTAAASSGNVPIVPSPSLQTLFMKYMVPGRPVVLTGVIDAWPARSNRSWSDPEYLRSVAGHRMVPVEVGGSYTGEGWQQRLMPLSEFLDDFLTGEGEGYLAQHQLFDQVPALRRDILVPDYCSMLLEDEEDDPQASEVAVNAWLGPAGTVSPCHHDPYHNLLAQVVGSKRVVLVDPVHSKRMYPHSGRMSNTSQVDVGNPDLSVHPEFAGTPQMSILLRAGEVLYIPPTWWHYIQSLEVSFSVSFWWGKRRGG